MMIKSDNLLNISLQFSLSCSVEDTNPKVPSDAMEEYLIENHFIKVVFNHIFNIE